MNPRDIIPTLTREEELILCCGRTELSAAARARLRELASGSADWARVEEIAKLHRLRPLLFKHLKAEGISGKVPPAIWASIQQHAVQTMARNLSLTNELAGIIKLFQGAGIEAIPFKGPVLAMRNYGNLGLRAFFDMDLLLRRGDILKAKKLLQERGFTSPWKQNEEWEAQHIDTQLGCDFLSADGKVRLELHWSFIQKWLTYEVDLDGIWKRSVLWGFAGVETRLVSRADLLVYLCAHGAKHHWERLFWIIDIAEFARSEKNLEWDSIVGNARAHGNWRVLALGLFLAHALLEAPIPDRVLTQIASDSSVPDLARQVGSWLFNEAKRPASGSRVETKFYVGVKERFADRAAYLWHLLRLAMAPSEKDRAFIKLPGVLSFLYPAVRPVRWLLTR